jgi:outer membrane protein assembly factor BamB
VNGESFVLDQVTGQVLSEFTFPDWLDHSPAFVDGVAFGSGKGPLYAVNTATGNSQWEIDTGYANVSTPAVADGSVFVALWNGDNTGMMAAFDAATGEQRWTYSSPSGLSFSATSVANGIVVAGGMDGSIYGIHAADGTLVWSVDSGTKLPIISAPGIANGTAYVGTGSGPILALDVATGAVLWTIPFDSGIGFGPIVADGIIVVETNFGEIHAFGVGGPAQATPDAVASPAASPITGEPGTLAAVWSTGDVDFKLKDRLASGRSARPGRLARP